MKFTTRLILTAALLAVSATAATAGPIRDRLAARFSRPCQSGQCQPQPQYTPGPVQTAAGTVLVSAGQVVQAAGVVVQSVQVPTFRPAGCQQCVGGVCR
jgi:hypothetical protein